MILRALGTFVFALNVLATVNGGPVRAAPVMIDVAVDDFAAKKKANLNDLNTKRLENQADKDKDVKDASKSLKSVRKDNHGNRTIEQKNRP